MRIIERFESDDRKVFSSKEECLVWETLKPWEKLHRGGGRLPKNGTPCRVVCSDDFKTTGLFIHVKHFDARKDGVATYRGWVAGHGGDVVWIVYPDGSVAVAMTTEVFDL